MCSPCMNLIFVATGGEAFSCFCSSFHNCLDETSFSSEVSPVLSIVIEWLTDGNLSSSRGASALSHF